MAVEEAWLTRDVAAVVALLNLEMPAVVALLTLDVAEALLTLDVVAAEEHCDAPLNSQCYALTCRIVAVR